MDINEELLDYLVMKRVKLMSLSNHSAGLSLTNKISKGFDGVLEITFSVNAPHQLNMPDVFIVAKIVKSVLNCKAVLTIYTFLSPG